MAAVVYNLEIEQGATYSLTIEWREDDGSTPPNGPLIDTTDYDAFLQIRQKPGGLLYADWKSTGEDPEIALDAGVIYLKADATRTNALTKQGVYDLELHNRTDPGDVVRLIQGKVILSLQVTEDD